MLEQAQQLMDALEVNKNDGNFEIAVDVIKKYGSYRKAMQASIKIEFKKKEAMLIALLGTEDNKQDSADTKEAKRLIHAVESMNTILFTECNKRGLIFEDFILECKFENLRPETKAILDSVRPHYNHKMLVKNIRQYQTSNDAVNAFKLALKFSHKDENLITNSSINRLRIKH